MRIAQNLIALGIVISLYMLAATLDEQDSVSTRDAQKSAQEQFHFELSAAKMCRESLGFGATFTMSATGEVVCIPPQPRK